MWRNVPLALLLVVVFAPVGLTQVVVDGAWIGSAQIGSETTVMMMTLETKDGTARGTVALPMENEEAPGSVAVEGNRLRFTGKGRSGPLQLEGDLEGRSFTGTIRKGEASGTFALYRSMSPDELAPYAGFYRNAPGRFVYIQPWDELGAQVVTLNEAGELRALFTRNDSTFVSGPAALQTQPVESSLTFARNGRGEVVSLTHQRGGRIRTFEKRRLYEGEDLQFKNGDITLAGTLFKPAGKAPYPVIVLTHGSGDQDRNAGLLFMVPLLEKGIAIFSYDKRGVGKSSGSWMTSGFDDLAADAVAAVDLLKKRSDLDRRHIGIWGLSQGGWIAPLAASRSKDIAFVVAVSAPAVTPEMQELTRTRYEMLADGEPAEDVELADSLYKVMNHWVRTGEGWDEYVAVRQKAAGKRWGPPPQPPKRDNPYYQFWRKILDYDPVPTLQKVTCPMLVVYGGLDQNVRSAHNAPVMEKALRAAGNRDFRVIVYPSGNHVMLEARNGSAREMAAVKRFVPGYLDTVTAWVLERVGRKP